MADYANDADGLLAAVGWDSCLVVGVSFGGMVAQELAIRHPARVQRLVLACTSAGGAGGSSYPLHELAALDGDALVERQLEIADTRWDAAWRVSHAAEYGQLATFFRAAVAARAEPGTPEALGAEGQLQARRYHDTWDRLGQITCPTLVAGGRYDGIAPPANSERLAERIPSAELAFFEGGHGFLFQDAQAYPRIVDFLRE
jgi:3-oxoadipate enol-lactonase